MNTHETTRSHRLPVVVALLCALLATLLAVACPASASTTKSREHDIALSVLRHINHERSLHHLRPVSMNSDLVLAAHRHNLTMARYDEMSHQLPGEAYFANRILAAGYRWSWAAENIAWNTQMDMTGVITLQKMMYAERAPYNEHRLNILGSHYKNVGVDVYFDTKHHKVWLTTDFGAKS